MVHAVVVVDHGHRLLGDDAVDDAVTAQLVGVRVTGGHEDVRFSGGLSTEVSDGDTVTILPAVAGG